MAGIDHKQVEFWCSQIAHAFRNLEREADRYAAKANDFEEQFEVAKTALAAYKERIAELEAENERLNAIVKRVPRHVVRDQEPQAAAGGEG